MPRFHTLTVNEVRRETPDCVSIAFDVPNALAEDFGFSQGDKSGIVYLEIRQALISRVNQASVVIKSDDGTDQL